MDSVSHQYLACTMLKLKRTAHGGTWVGGNPYVDGGFDLDKFNIGDGYQVVASQAVSGYCRDALAADGSFQVPPGAEVAKVNSVSGWIRVLRSSFDNQMRPTEGGFSISYEVCGVRTEILDAYVIMTSMPACRLGL